MSRKKQGRVYNEKVEKMHYCRYDCIVLMLAMQKYRELVWEETGICPWTSSLTTASLAWRIYSTLFLEEQHQITESTDNGKTKCFKGVKVGGKFFEIVDGMKREVVNVVSSEFISIDIAYWSNGKSMASGNYSTESMQWIKWMEHEKGIKLQHATSSAAGEWLMPGTRYKLDAVDHKNNKFYDYHG